MVGGRAFAPSPRSAGRSFMSGVCKGPLREGPAPWPSRQPIPRSIAAPNSSIGIEEYASRDGASGLESTSWRSCCSSDCTMMRCVARGSGAPDASASKLFIASASLGSAPWSLGLSPADAIGGVASRAATGSGSGCPDTGTDSRAFTCRPISCGSVNAVSGVVSLYP